MFEPATSMATRLYRSAVRAVLSEEKPPDMTRSSCPQARDRLGHHGGTVGRVALGDLLEAEQRLARGAQADGEQLAVGLGHRRDLAADGLEGLLVVEQDRAPRLVHGLG